MPKSKGINKTPKPSKADKKFLTLLQQEYDSPNPNYYSLFGLKQTKDSTPLDEQSQARTRDMAARLVVVIQNSSRSKNKKAEWIKCKSMITCKHDILTVQQ
jgi:hypothetical protein